MISMVIDWLSRLYYNTSDKKASAMEVNEANPVPRSLNPYIKLYKLNIDVHKSLKEQQRQETDDGQFVKENQSNRLIEDTQTMRVVLDRVTIYECKQCYFCYTTERDYRLHILKHAKPVVITEYSQEKHSNYVKRFQCEECDKRFVAESTLEAHSVVHLPFPHQCHCGIGFHKQDDLKAHKRLVHPELEQEKVWQPITSYRANKIKSEYCVKSEYIPPQSNAIKTMLGVYIPKKPLTKVQKKRKKKSQQKNRNFTNVTLPHVKSEIVTVNGKIRYACLICKKQLSSYNALKFHNLTHTGERPFKCNMCDKSYTQSANLKVHQLKVHVGITYECPVCEKRLTQKSAVTLHMRKHTGERPYKCELCGKDFADPSAYGRHVRIHTGDKRYKCPDCPMAFTDASGLIMHKRRHAGIKNFRCEICEKTFYTSQCVVKHVNSVHARRLNYECDHCGKRCSNKANLMMHIIRMGVHSRMKCELCPRVFINMHLLKKHMNIHKILKHNDCVCDICGESFDRKASIAKHFKMEHNV